MLQPPTNQSPFMRYLSALLIMLLLFFGRIFASNNKYVVIHYTTDQGLSQNSIKSINFDKAGYCWLGTEMGLVRFDGVNFKIFGSDDIKGLHSDRVGTAGNELSGNIYFEMDNGQQIAITVIQSKAPTPVLLKGQKMYFSLPNSLALKLPDISQKLGNLVYAVKNSGWDNYCISTQKGCLYLILRNKVYFVNGNSLKVIDSISKPYDRSFAVIKEKLVRFVTASKIRVWENGVLQPQFQNVSGLMDKNKKSISGNYELVSSATGTYLHAGRIVYRIDIEGSRLTSEAVLKDIDIKDIYTVYYHSEQQRYYIGTLTSGLYIISPNVFHYPQITGSFRSQVATKGGEGIVCENYLFHRKGTIDALPINRLIGAYIDTANVLYYGNATELFKFNLNTRQKKKLFDLDSRPADIIGDNINRKYIWIGTSLSVGRLYKDTSYVFKQVPGRNEGKTIIEITQTGQDSFLLSTQEGLKWYDWEHNRIFRSILDSFSIHGIYAESQDCIWISTYGKGFFLYRKGKVYKFPYGAFGALKSVHSFVDDGKGYFWLPTNNGLYKVNKKELLAYAAGRVKEIYYYAFSTPNGLRSNEFNGASTPNYVWLNDSMLSLVSIKGIVWFYPGNVPIDYPDKSVYVDQFEINDSVIPYPLNNHVSLEPDFNNISLAVSSPYFGNKENLQLRYKVEGFGTDWQPLAANGKIQLNRLPSGKYKLIVRKLTGRKVNQYDSLVLSITVKPWFYNTWWFYIAVFLLAGFIMYRVIKLRTRLLMEHNRKLQAVIDDQTRDLRNTVGLLSTSEQQLNESNRMKENIITMILHDLRSPLQFLQYLSRSTARNYSAFNEKELKQRFVEINTSIATLNDFTEQFFSWAVSQRENFRVNNALISLGELFEELESLYGDLVTINNNQLLVSANECEVYSDKNILSAIIRNLLDNANKNTKNGIISLTAVRTETYTIISVTDTGKGLSDMQRNALSRIGTYNNATLSGYGHLLIADLLKKIDGKLEIESKPDKGTTFNIQLFENK